MKCPKCGKFAKNLVVDNFLDSRTGYLCKCKCGETFVCVGWWTHEPMMGEAVHLVSFVEKDEPYHKYINSIYQKQLLDSNL